MYASVTVHFLTYTDLLFQLASSTADFSIGQGVGESEYDDTGVDFESSPALPTAGANENTMQRLEELEATNQRLQVQVQSHALTADQLRQELDRSSTRLQEQESVHEQALDQLRALQSQNLDSDGLRQELDRSEAQLRQENAMHGQALAELQTKLAEARDDIVNKQREIQMLLAKVSGLEEEKRVLTEAKQDASGRAMEDDAERGDLCAQRDEALEGEQSARHDLRNTVQALEKVQRISMAENPDLLDRYGMVQNTVAQLDTGRPYTVRVMTAVNDLGHCSFDCHDCPADQVDSTEFIHFAQHWWSEATSPPASLIYIGRGSQLFHTGTQDDFIDALRGMRRCTIVKHEMRTAYEGRYQMPWTGRMRLTDGTALDYNSSEQMQVVLSKREMQIVPSKIVPSKIVPSKIVPSKIVPSKRKILTAKEIVEPPKRTKVVQDRRKGYQRIQLPNPKLLTASTSTAASPPSQEYDLPGSELSRRVSPEGRVYEVDDGDVL